MEVVEKEEGGCAKLTFYTLESELAGGCARL